MPFSRRVGVIGSSGQLGSDIVRRLSQIQGYEVVPLAHAELDVRDTADVRSVISDGRFFAVINCAAFHRVEECEERVAESFAVNAQGALNVAAACGAVNAVAVFVSTDYVFAGDKGDPYDESDPPRPVNVYGVSKLAGELLVQAACPQALVFRISSVFGRAGASGKGGNFIEAILAKARAGGPVRVVNDAWMTPTYTVDAADALAALLGSGTTGTVHGSNSGRCTWFEFAAEAVRLVGLDIPVEPISSKELRTKARRPRDSSMCSVRMQTSAGVQMRPWSEALRAYLLEKEYLA